MAFDGSTIGAATTGAFVGATFTDTFSVGNNDVDMVRIDLVAGTRYVIDIDNGTAGDFYLRVFDAFGNEVRANDDGVRSTDDVVFSLSPYLEFTPGYSGVYYVAVSPYYLDDYDPATTAGRVTPENPLAVTAGTLTVTALSTTTFWPSAGSINAITAEDSSDLTDLFRDEDESLRVQFIGAVDSPGDVDMARVDLNKNDIVVIDVNGLEGNGVVLRVFDDTGVQIGFDDDAGFGEDPELIFVAPVLDDYYIGLSGEGNSTYDGLDGANTLAGAVGDFEVIVHRNPTQIGSSLANAINGDETANYVVALAGLDTVTGGDGRDTLAGGDDGDSLRGGNGQDVVYGEQGDDALFGDKGRDVLSGGIGLDTLDGGAADDILEGGAGADSIDGGKSGLDTLRGDAGSDTLNGGSSDDLLLGGADNDSLLGGTDNDTLRGDDGLDTLNGGQGNDSLFGGAGNDSLLGGSENDALFGDAGDDTLLGGVADDRLTGGAGLDTLNGAAGADLFAFVTTADGLDTIEDLILGTDRIDLAAIFAATASVVTAGNLAQFVQCTPAGAGADSFLAIDANGAVGGLAFTIVAQVNGVTAGQLFDIDNFVV